MSSSQFQLRLATDRLALATEPVVCLTLEQIAREGARRALRKAIEDEVVEYIDARHKGVTSHYVR